MTEPSPLLSLAIPQPGGGEGSDESGPVRRHLTPSQAGKVERLVNAGIEEVRATGYDGLTVRNVAARAGVAAATAYTYFSSKDHLIAEAFWQRVKQLPEVTFDPSLTVPERVGRALSGLGRLVVEEPELTSASTTAMLSLDPDVKRVCDRIGGRIASHLRKALGDDVPPQVLMTLALAYSGACLQAGMGYMDYSDITKVMEMVASLIYLGPGSARAPGPAEAAAAEATDGAAPGSKDPSAPGGSRRAQSR